MTEKTQNKGQYLGTCNMSSCETGNVADWYNHGSQAYYCKGCAKRLNHDEFNQRDAAKLLGHDLCTEGEHVVDENEPQPEVKETAINLTKAAFQKLPVGSHLVGVNKIGKGYLVVTEVNEKKEYSISLPNIEQSKIVHNIGYLTVFSKRNLKINTNHIFLLFYEVVHKELELTEDKNQAH
jgi:hypothetical protein